MRLLKRFGWVAIGLLVAATIAVMLPAGRARLLMGFYTVLNLLGTAYVLWEVSSGEDQTGGRSRTVRFMEHQLPGMLKMAFVAQLPLGLLLFMLNGI